MRAGPPADHGHGAAPAAATADPLPSLPEPLTVLVALTASFWAERMTLPASRLVLANVRSAISGLEVIGADTGADAAQVMQDHAERDDAVDLRPDHTMGVLAVELSVSEVMNRPDPRPTA